MQTVPEEKTAEEMERTTGKKVLTEEEAVQETHIAAKVTKELEGSPKTELKAEGKKRTDERAPLSRISLVSDLFCIYS